MFRGSCYTKVYGITISIGCSVLVCNFQAAKSGQSNIPAS